MRERAIFLDEFPRLPKSGYRFLFVGSRIDGNGDYFVEPVPSQVRNIPEITPEAAKPPKSRDLIRSL